MANLGNSFDGDALAAWMPVLTLLLLLFGFLGASTTIPASLASRDRLNRRLGRASMANLARSLVAAAGRGLLQFLGFFLVFKFQEVGHIEEGVALQAHIHKCGLHAGQDPCDAAVVNGAGQGVFVFAFVVDLRELIVFKDCKPRFMRRAGNANLFCHRTFPSSAY
jgi:hypothetical protein